ncbi:hypothetical protein B296_00030564 [Ensete ventricosum]|uniref:Uncharacterized protein n=1 Tax=Ensete ventricosum TaxID=4639 RepID=A0A426ZEC5_ENSVE|nr:hypothetical protein B296_00030564 [Ensete ventricosum]
MHLAVREERTALQFKTRGVFSPNTFSSRLNPAASRSRQRTETFVNSTVRQKKQEAATDRFPISRARRAYEDHQTNGTPSATGVHQIRDPGAQQKARQSGARKVQGTITRGSRSRRSGGCCGRARRISALIYEETTGCSRSTRRTAATGKIVTTIGRQGRTPTASEGRSPPHPPSHRVANSIGSRHRRGPV